MVIITIDEKIAKEKELFAVPKNTYKEFLMWQKILKSSKTYKPTAAEKRELQKARIDFKNKKYTNLYKLKNELGIDS